MTQSESFKSKIKITGKPSVAGNTKDVEITVQVLNILFALKDNCLFLKLSTNQNWP